MEMRETSHTSAPVTCLDPERKTSHLLALTGQAHTHEYACELMMSEEAVEAVECPTSRKKVVDSILAPTTKQRGFTLKVFAPSSVETEAMILPLCLCVALAACENC